MLLHGHDHSSFTCHLESHVLTWAYKFTMPIQICYERSVLNFFFVWCWEFSAAGTHVNTKPTDSDFLLCQMNNCQVSKPARSY